MSRSKHTVEQVLSLRIHAMVWVRESKQCPQTCAEQTANQHQVPNLSVKCGDCTFLNSEKQINSDVAYSRTKKVGQCNGTEIKSFRDRLLHRLVFSGVLKLFKKHDFLVSFSVSPMNDRHLP